MNEPISINQILSCFEKMGVSYLLDELPDSAAPIYTCDGAKVMYLKNSSRLPAGYLLVDSTLFEETFAEKFSIPLCDKIYGGMVRSFCHMAIKYDLQDVRIIYMRDHVNWPYGHVVVRIGFMGFMREVASSTGPLCMYPSRLPAFSWPATNPR